MHGTQHYRNENSYQIRTETSRSVGEKENLVFRLLD
tara:strand:- start:527 stop:634 length:108 start_codon:yes stop_codon:yes gene_type:complete